MARRRHDRKVMEALLRRREEQGLTYAELSASSGVPVTTLAWWSSHLRRLGRSGGRRAASGSGFVEIVPVDANGAGDRHVEITLAGGRRLVVREEIAPDTLQRLVAALEG